MNRLQRRIVVFIMFRIDWKNLFLAGMILTIVGVFYQNFTLPYPLVELFNAPHTTRLSNNHLLGNTPPLAKLEHSYISPTAPVVLLSHSNSSLIKGDDSEVLHDRIMTYKKGGNMIKSDGRGKSTKSLPLSPSVRDDMHLKLQRQISSLKPVEALTYAKNEIEHGPNVSDPEIYAPLFKNASVFIRSYKLMEMILKIYVYADGARPIFHHPHLRGIYASEGWFMKLMEENKQFRTKNPEGAHLFYLPYSSRQLEWALYVPGSHNLKPLSIFLRDYVNMISAKYPFWNRTRGLDHFLVACHDWGPYTVTEHDELRTNTIKALCNADLSEGIFVNGKDVSLPETTIRNPRKPLRYVGGKRVSQRNILAFFAGGMHGRVRPKLIKYWHGKDEEIRIYGRLPNRVSSKMSYVEHMKSSRFCICPMGFEVNSPRIVESIYYECVPVIIADNFAPPFDDVFDWNAFSIRVAEADIPNLKHILAAVTMRKYLTMQFNVKALQKHFFWNPRPLKYDIFHMILHSIWFSRVNQINSFHPNASSLQIPHTG